jgi:iron complex outermembrane receptor protein
MRTPSAGLILALCLVLYPGLLPAQNSEDGPAPQSSAAKADRDQAAQEAKQAADLDLDQLANLDIKVTSASKKSERLNDAPAAIYVLSGEDIRRGGFSSIPDALRMVPGLYVAQEDSHSWIVAARGFSWAFNNKMLVLQDGRLLYQPLFGGVYWDTIDPPLEDIDRIEVIRGPGGALWGANAVNGVINIITKKAEETKGLSVTTSAGIDQLYRANIRFGGGVGSNLSYRVFGQALYDDATVNALGASQVNPGNLNQGGTRMDWQISPKDGFSFDGQGYRGAVSTSELNFSGPTVGASELREQSVMQGGHILGRWTHHFSDRSSTDVLAYCDWESRADVLGGDARNTCDVEVQHDFRFTPRHSVIWGGSILTTSDTPSHTFEISYSPGKERDNTYSVFGQYEVSVVPDKLRLIGGSKFEHNAFTGFEVQPQVRAVWTPNKTSTVWGAISRAVREPDRINSDVDLKFFATLGGPLPVFGAATGNQSLASEALRAYELGYRYQPRRTLSFDLAAYYNDYSNLIGTGPPVSPIIFPGYVEIPFPFINAGKGQTHGLELSVQLRPIHRWEISTGVTELRGTTVLTGSQGIVTPHHIINFQSRFDLTRHFNFDASYFYTDALRELGLPTLNRVDVGISTRQFAGFTFSAWGRNLQSDHHLENNSGEPYFPAGEVRRSVVLKLTWQRDSERGKKP